MFTWIYGVVIDRLYDVFLGVYVMVWIGGHRFTVSITHVFCVVWLGGVVVRSRTSDSKITGSSPFRTAVG